MRNDPGALTIVFEPEDGGHSVRAADVFTVIMSLRQVLRRAAIIQGLENAENLDLDLVGTPQEGSLRVPLDIVNTVVAISAMVATWVGVALGSEQKVSLNGPLDEGYRISQDSEFQDAVRGLARAAGDCQCASVTVEFPGIGSVTLHPTSKSSSFREAYAPSLDDDGNIPPAGRRHLDDLKARLASLQGRKMPPLDPTYLDQQAALYAEIEELEKHLAGDGWPKIRQGPID